MRHQRLGLTADADYSSFCLLSDPVLSVLSDVSAADDTDGASDPSDAPIAAESARLS
jgi:hypothetical protein